MGLKRCLAGLMALAYAAAAPLVALAEPASDGRYEVAQLFKDDRPFLQRLFGGGRDPEPPRNGPKILRVPRNGDLPGVSSGEPAPKKPRKTRPKKPVVVQNPKNDDAKVVLVIGDRLADSLAKGLDVAFSDTPTLKIENGAVSPSGLVDPAKKDWIKDLEARMASADPPEAVVVMLGSEDRGPAMVDGVETAFRMKSWETVYEARVRALIGVVRAKQVPVYWTGLVPMADIGMTTDMAYLDELYRRASTENFARYVDVWNAFADETGSFVASGPDVGGKVRQLRLKDGVGFTKSGSRKLAFYVEQELRSWLKSGAPGGVVLPQQTVEGGLVLSLNDPEVGPEEDLAGPDTAAVPKQGTPLYDLVVLGRPLPPRVGRVDDLSTN
jgi:hypothetical protein